ncbi:MAG: type-F conjugative transfer system pilin assembly protein TrbC [Rickettsiaceae bacterium]|nr:type-F conjugative transfer system pilin assembly protein TrbC [Rickettsiaceae bacterium]
MNLDFKNTIRSFKLFLGLLVMLFAGNSLASADFVEDFGCKIVKQVQTNQFGISAGEMREINKLARMSQNISLNSIFEKWQELQQIIKVADTAKMDLGLASGNGDLNVLEQLGGEIKIFVSSSMGKRLLQHYWQEGRKYGATLIFNGLPNDASGKGSFRELIKLVEAVAGSLDASHDLAGMQINDKEFKEFSVTQVPTIVMLKSINPIKSLQGNNFAKFDKVTGNVGIRSALELFEREGDLKDLAAKFLKLAKK